MIPGQYTVFFHNEGWPDNRTDISLKPGESLPVNCIFPHGTATITSMPDGAEIFLGERSLGRTPLTIDLPPGKQSLIGRHPDFPNRTQTIAIETDKSANVAFQFRARSRSSSKAKPKPTPTAFDKLVVHLRLGQSLLRHHRSPAKNTDKHYPDGPLRLDTVTPGAAQLIFLN